MCGSPPREALMGTWPRQAWCSNDDCDAMNWDATKTLDENLMNASVQRLPGTEA